MTIEELQAAVSALDERVGEVLNLNLDEFVSNYQLERKKYVDIIELENRIDDITPTELPTDLITASELETRIANIQIPELPSNIITESELETRISQIPTGATAQDVALAAAAVDAKFDMLRAAISEATDYHTLKARLLAVLQ